MPKNHLIITILFLSCCFLFIAFYPVLAQEKGFQSGLSAVQGSSGLTNESFTVYATTFVKALLGLTGIVFFALLIYGGVLYMMSAGEADKVKKGKSALKSAVIGMCLILGAYIMTSFIGNVIEQKTGPGSVPGFNEKCENSTDMNYYSLDCCEYRYQVYTSTSDQCCGQTTFYESHSDACGGTPPTYDRCNECGSGLTNPCDLAECESLSNEEYRCNFTNMPWPQPNACEGTRR